MNKQTIKLQIQNCRDRENIVSALANSKYKVWVEREEHLTGGDKFFVLFEKENDEIGEVITKNKINEIKKILQEFDDCYFCEDEGGEGRKVEMFLPKILDCIYKQKCIIPTEKNNHNEEFEFGEELEEFQKGFNPPIKDNKNNTPYEAILHKIFDDIENENKDCKKEEWDGWKIVSDMLNNPDKNGIYPTSECYKKLYKFVCEQKDKQKEKIKKEQYSWLSPNKFDSARSKIVRKFLDEFYNNI